MPIVTFDVPTAVATRINTAAQAEGFANGKQWIKNLVRQALIRHYNTSVDAEVATIRQQAEADARTAVDLIS